MTFDIVMNEKLNDRILDPHPIDFNIIDIDEDNIGQYSKTLEELRREQKMKYNKKLISHPNLDKEYSDMNITNVYDQLIGLNSISTNYDHEMTMIEKKVSPIQKIHDIDKINRQLIICSKVKYLNMLLTHFLDAFQNSHNSINNVIKMIKIYSQVEEQFGQEYKKIFVINEAKKTMKEKLKGVNDIINTFLTKRGIENVSSLEIFQIFLIAKDTHSFFEYFNVRSYLKTNDFINLIQNSKKIYLFLQKYNSLEKILISYKNINDSTNSDLIGEKEKILQLIPDSLQEFMAKTFKEIKFSPNSPMSIEQYYSSISEVFFNFKQDQEIKEFLPLDFFEQKKKIYENFGLDICDTLNKIGYRDIGESLSDKQAFFNDFLLKFFKEMATEIPNFGQKFKLNLLANTFSKHVVHIYSDSFKSMLVLIPVYISLSKNENPMVQEFSLKVLTSTIDNIKLLLVNKFGMIDPKLQQQEQQHVIKQEFFEDFDPIETYQFLNDLIDSYPEKLSRNVIHFVKKFPFHIIRALYDFKEIEKGSPLESLPIIDEFVKFHFDKRDLIKYAYESAQREFKERNRYKFRNILGNFTKMTNPVDKSFEILVSIK
ncbi:hypothetical protein TRFO_09741 [Tritrichomonas foetus]|uniref:Uncharacterized protein n=1 Tax=Tritrichomonas foetus TaxID=1144522 RepID=A0A1J4JEW9_9EUKA|nr:hypothetical protein TRFO_09741 [Tritrichomonas foetus]|eukprot:OHS96847.1 hypothetical protein TRFO_09741 [Tritrichomonas foetus]